MADRSITWQRTGGKTHRVIVDDGPPLPFNAFERLINAQYDALRQAGMSNAGLNQHFVGSSLDSFASFGSFAWSILG